MIKFMLFQTVILITIQLTGQDKLDNRKCVGEFGTLACLAKHIQRLSREKVRPVINYRTSVNVRLLLATYQLVDVYWNDEFAFWDPADFDNITSLQVDANSIWKPDTYLYSNLEMDQDRSERIRVVTMETFAERRISEAHLHYPAIYKFSCKMRVNDFPFDTQVCDMIFGSWSHLRNTINYELFSDEKNVSLAQFTPNQQWDVRAFYGWSVVSEYFNANYSTIVFRLVLRRKPMFYCINLVLPSIIVGAINFIGLFTSSTSYGVREEKLTLALTTLLAQGILLLHLADYTPSSSTSIPLIGRFLTAQLILIAISAIITVVIIELQHRGESCRTTNRHVRTFVKISERIMRPFCLISWQPGDDGKDHQDIDDTELWYGLVPNSERNTLEELIVQNYACETNETSCKESIRERRLKLLCQEMHKIRTILLHLTTSTRQEVEGHSDWILAAVALERMCLVLFCTSCFLMTIGFFVRGAWLQSDD